MSNSQSAVIAGELKHVSASQISTFKLCNRKWWFDKVANEPREESPAMARGERTHTMAEKFYTEEKPIEPSTIEAQSLIKLLADPLVPRPGPYVLIEQPRNFQMGIKLADIPVKGKIDLLDATRSRIAIWDWKTCGSFGTVKKIQDLFTDAQMVIYAMFSFINFDCKRVTLTHGNIRTKGKPAYSIVQTPPVNRGHFAKEFDMVAKVVEEMKETAKIPESTQVKPNWHACTAYGGCRYSPKCKFSFKTESAT
jgi:hypothetical protein